MAGDSFGVMFKVTNWGESHGYGLGTVVEGCPPGIYLQDNDIQKELDRRRPGQSSLTTPRKENDQVKILSGIEKGLTTGAPLSLMIRNQDHRSQDYLNLNKTFRPSHADFTYEKKYGLRSIAGGGRSSARLTAGTVAAGAIAKKILKEWFNCNILAYVISIKNLKAKIPKSVTQNQVEANSVRCPDPVIAKKMANLIEKTKKAGNSLGGIIECVSKNVPVGLGEPIYDKLEADLGKAVLGINACKGFEIGSGFGGTTLLGSEHNDRFLVRKGKVMTETNHSGGVQGGITNGMPIIFRAAFKPTATILRPQSTINVQLKKETFTVKGRHDPCVLPRAVPIIEAVTALVLIDHTLRHRGQIGHLP